MPKVHTMNDLIVKVEKSIIQKISATTINEFNRTSGIPFVSETQEIMGGWKLEVAKMAIYLAFPVAAFHVFNSPQYFEQYVIQKKREMYPHEDQLYYDELALLLRDMNSGNLDKKIEQLNAFEKNRKNRTDDTKSSEK